MGQIYEVYGAICRAAGFGFPEGILYFHKLITLQRHTGVLSCMFICQPCIIMLVDSVALLSTICSAELCSQLEEQVFFANIDALVG